MKKILSAVIGFIVLALAPLCGFSQESTWVYAVQISATVQTAPPQISLSWPQDTQAVPNSYTVYRKAPSATSWGAGTTLPGTTLSYIDSNVAVGSTYEYQIVKQSPLGYTGYGYILSGIQAPLVDLRGKVILVVEKTYAPNLADELTRLQQDLAGDGWSVIRHDVARTDTPASVKSLIKTDYNADPANVKAVFLFGRVPVLRSGNLNVDGHLARPMPADVFYGEMDGAWTDSNGDGIYDQSNLPSDVELQVGRVDFYNMTGATGGATWPSEQELLRQYLNKDHNFRQRLLTAPRRGLVGDRFGLYSGEAFAASAYRNFSTFFGPGNTTTSDASDTAPLSSRWISYLTGNTYLWAFGCGGGSAMSMSELGSHGTYFDVWSTDIVAGDAKAIFNMQFGSFLCDWDTQDNIMRSVLATPTMGLTCSWSGRPHHFYHAMAMGETVGYGIRASQNNNGLYQNQIDSQLRGIHIALMGDPTLRLFPVAPASTLTGTLSSSGASLNWQPSSDAVQGYHVYRSPNATGPFTRVTTSLVTGTSFSDPTVTSGTYTYLVRAVKLDTSASGTYYNASQGAFTTLGAGAPPPTDSISPSVSITAPGNNATVSGSTVSVSATATDNVGVVGVQFKLDGVNLGSEVSAAPYSVSWDTTKATDGSHSLTAVARDAAGNQATATPVTILVSNGTTPTTLSTITVVASDNIATIGTSDTGVFTFTRSGDTSSALTVNFALGGSAVKWSDYRRIEGDMPVSLTIAAGYASTNMTITAVANTTGANPETVTLTLSQDPAYTVGSPNSATITISNTAPSDTTPPSVSMAAPANGATVSGSTVTISANATDNVGVASVQFLLDGANLGANITTAPYSMVWNTTGSANGTHTLSAIARDAAGNQTTASAITVNVSNVASDTVPPSVSVTAPSNNSTVLGATVVVSATAADNIGVVGVQFKLDGANLGSEFTAGPYNLNWDTTKAVDGTHSVSAVARDAAGNQTTAAAISVLVNNGTTTTNPPPSTVSVVDDTNLQLPKPGNNTLHVLSPTLLELVLINTKQPDPALVDSWNFVDSSFQFHAPASTEFAVTVNGQSVAVQSVGFKRRALYAPNAQRDLRIENSLCLQLANTIGDNQTVDVKNPDGTLWQSTMQFATTADPVRYSPAIHVNQEGYVPSFPKKAMVGYYLGNLGEMPIPAAGGFALIDANTGAQVFQGPLTLRQDVGYTYTPTPYQQVYVADFSAFTTPGEYRLKVPGLGASLPFLIDEGVAMSFARAYALGLYHQRCGTNNVLPFTRFTHDPCHIAAAGVPSPESSFAFTWNTIAMYALRTNNENPPQIAPIMTNEAAQLFPYVNKGTVDVSGGHHDAGDYSKYTINSTRLIHQLMFASDALPGVGALDNLGIPESGDGISDVMQEAKWEADFLVKMQDADGGFYTLVYPMNREYENNVLPDQGDPQVAWPKTTSVTAASVAALAQCASSPRFKAQYPAAASLYMQKAQLGWTFLMNAIAKYGKDGSYQKTIHYGDNFIHNDELAWAACEMFLATGDPSYQQKLIAWFDPSDPATFRWSWWRMSECYGNAIRSFAFAAQTGRLQSSQLDATFMSKCQAQILAAGDDALNWSKQNAYGSSFPDATKRVMSAGWYFSVSQAYDITVAYQLNPKPDYLDALVANMNFEGGCNPVNVAYVTGLGWKRQREIVHQYAQNDRRVLPPSGIPLGSIQTGFVWLAAYGSELGALNFPQDNATTTPYPFYDRWGDSFNVTTEFVNVDQARGLANLAFLATLTPTKSQTWSSATAQINVPSAVATNTLVTATVQVPNLDLSGTRIVWEAAGQEPAYGPSYAFSSGSGSSQWVEVEVQWPDGRRAFGASTFAVTNGLPSVSVVATDAQGSEAGPDPITFTFTRTGDTSSAMTVNYLLAGTATKWDDYRRLEGDIPVSVVIPAGSASATLTVSPVDDSVIEGTETIVLTVAADAAYNVGTPSSATAYIADNDSTTSTLPTISVTAADPNAAEAGLDPGVFTITRTGSTTNSLTVNFSLSGTANNGTDYNTLATSVTMAAGSASTTVVVTPVDDTLVEGDETVILTLTPDAAYTVGSSSSATVTISDNDFALPTITVAATDPNASEAGTDPGVFTFTRAGSTSNAVTVNYTLTGTATKWDDYRRIEGDMPVSIVIPAGATSATLTIYPVDDAIVEGSETVILTIASDPAYVVGSQNSGTVVIADNDTITPQTISVVATDANAAEAGSDPGVYTFTRTGDTSSAVTVNYTLAGTATKWDDYRRIEGDMPTSIVIPAGATSATLTIYPVDDTVVEGPETVILTVTPDATYVVGSPSTATVTIADNDSMPTVSVVANDSSASRVGPDSGQYTFTRTGSTANALIVNYSLGGSATKWTDYRTPAGDMPVSVTIPAGAASTTLTIVPQPSTSLVSSETVILALTSDPAYTVGSSSAATITIAGNSIPISSMKTTGAGVTITWSSQAGKVYRVAYKNNTTDANWTDLSGNVTASGSTTSWTDRSASKFTQRLYTVYVTN